MLPKASWIHLGTEGGGLRYLGPCASSLDPDQPSTLASSLAGPEGPPGQGGGSLALQLGKCLAMTSTKKALTIHVSGGWMGSEWFCDFRHLSAK